MQDSFGLIAIQHSQNKLCNPGWGAGNGCYKEILMRNQHLLMWNGVQLYVSSLVDSNFLHSISLPLWYLWMSPFCHQDWLSISPRKYGAENKRNVNTNSGFLCIQAERHIFFRRSRKLITTTCYSASLSSALISCLEINKHVSWFNSNLCTKALL